MPKTTTTSDPAHEDNTGGLQALEQQANRDPGQWSASELESLVRRLASAASNTKDFRVKQRLLKRAAFLVRKACDSDIQDARLLREWMNLVQTAAAMHAFPQDLRKLHGQLTKRWLEASGHKEPRLLARKKASLSTEVATFAIGDADIAPGTPLGDDLAAAWMQAGERLIFTTGGDGTYRFEIRLIDALEPVLEAKEYARITGATPTLVLAFPTGRLGIASLHDMVVPWGARAVANRTELRVEPSNHKVCVYGKSSGDITVVLCKTEDATPNKLDGLDMFTLFA